jgi:biotin-dependent carboxylase-like uncharacterized protein
MTQPTLRVDRIGPAVTVQDLGRPGQLAMGLSQGGAADRYAIAEGAALLGHDLGLAALEMPGFGGDFVASAPLRIALTGAPMTATMDGAALQWNASHHVAAGQRLRIGAVISGAYGYLHIGGGFATPKFLNSRSAHLAGGIGAPVAVGDVLPVGPDSGLDQPGYMLDVADRFSGGTLRLLPGVHTDLFGPEIRARFAATRFTKTPRGNRQGVELAFDGAPFATEQQLSVLSEPMLPGDIQMTGQGMPYVLLPECQTTGGYPRIGTVMPDDVPKLVQAAPGVALRFAFTSHPEAMAQHRSLDAFAAEMRSKRRALIRKPHEIADLLGYQLISGMITGWEQE